MSYLKIKERLTNGNSTYGIFLNIKIIGYSTIYYNLWSATKFEIFINFFFSLANEINFTFENVKWYFRVLNFDSEEIEFGNSLDRRTFICWFCCLPCIRRDFNQIRCWNKKYTILNTYISKCTISDRFSNWILSKIKHLID